MSRPDFPIEEPKNCESCEHKQAIKTGNMPEEPTQVPKIILIIREKIIERIVERIVYIDSSKKG